MTSQQTFNRPFARSGHMVWNKLCWDANNAMGLSKQRNSYQSCPTLLVLQPELLLLQRENQQDST